MGAGLEVCDQVVGLIHSLSKVTKPLVFLLTVSTNAMLRLLRHAWRLGRKVMRAMRADHCPLPLPSFAYLAGEGDMARLHRACQRLDVARCVTAASWVRLLISTLSWPGSALAGGGRHGAFFGSVVHGDYFFYSC